MSFLKNVLKSTENFFSFGPKGSKKNQNIMLGVATFGIIFGIVQLRYAFNLMNGETPRPLIVKNPTPEEAKALALKNSTSPTN